MSWFIRLFNVLYNHTKNKGERNERSNHNISRGNISAWAGIWDPRDKTRCNYVWAYKKIGIKMKTQVLEYIDALAFGDEEVKEEAHDFLYSFVKTLEI